MSAYRWKSFDEDEDRPEKPRRYGVTEMSGPHFTLLSQNVLQDIFESMGQFVDGLKFSGGSHSLMPKSFVKEVTDLAHKHDIYVSTGDWAEHLLHKGPSAFKEYVEECKQLGFDTIELNVGSLGVPEETLLRFVRLIKSAGLKAKPQFAVKFNKSDIPVDGDRAFGAYIAPRPRSTEFVEDVDLLLRRSVRCLEAGADMIMIDADDVCKHADSVRADIIAKVIGRLGLEKTMFEASNPRASEWFINQYGPRVNLFVDHSHLMDLECLRGRNLVQTEISIEVSRALQKDEPIIEKTKDTEMSMVWIALKNSLDCRKLQLPSDVHDPEANGNPSTWEKRPGRSRCLGSISNLREKPLGCSARTPWSSESLNPVTHKIVLDDPTTCETKTGPLCVSHKDRDRGRDIGPTFVGNLRPWTTDHSHRVPHCKPSGPTSSIRTHGGSIIFDDGGGGIHICSNIRRSNETDYNGSSTLICQMCGEKFRKLDAIEGHRLSKHAVIELGEGDSSRKIVEKICQKSWLKTQNNCRRMERVLKVQNMPTNVSCFEEHRETMKIKASRLPKRHPRCLVDGNELLMFYGTTVVCSLGMNNDSCSLCTLDNCGVCQALRHGFLAKKECNGGLGVFTTSSSERALESIETDEADRSVRKALMVCRVVAGRVHKPGESIQDMTASGFDSLARKMGSHSNVEELYVLNPQAILPCFVVIISKGSFV